MPGRAVLLLLTALVAAALALAWQGEDDAGYPPLTIPALAGSGSTVVVDAFGRPLRRIADARGAEAAQRWLGRARPLGEGAPRWARRMQARSLLVLRALTWGTGAVIAGARNRWAYVWPRDAGAVAVAYAASGYGAEARQVARFLRGLDLEAAARFRPDGTPVPGRAAQGDAAGWVAAASHAAGLPRHTIRDRQAASGASPGHDLTARDGSGRRSQPSLSNAPPPLWRDRADYHEGAPGDYLANALSASGSAVPYPRDPGIRNSGTGGAGLIRAFRADGALVRIAGDPESGWDSAAAWGVRPFAQPALFPAIRRTLRRAAASSGRFGIVPSENWAGGDDPWTAPTAWTAWGLAALARDAIRDSEARGTHATTRDPDVTTGETHVPAEGSERAAARADRRAALRLMDALRRAATPLGLLPERVDARTGLPASTTPLAWSHAFATLALHELWPPPPR